MQYDLVTDKDREKYAPELVGQRHVLVKRKEKIWVVKNKPISSNEEKRDLLAYLLGSPFANVAEVYLPTNDEIQQINTLRESEVQSLQNHTSYLIRLGGSYRVDEICCKTLEKAVASELVFSVWIRRRDVHANNRVYLIGIPIFFDHGTAFLGQKELADIKSFFGVPAPEGHGGAWRIKVTQAELSTIWSRQHPIDYHYVNNIDDFKGQIDQAKGKIKDVSIDRLKDLISVAGFQKEETEQIWQFLKINQRNIDDDVEMMKTIIFQDLQEQSI